MKTNFIKRILLAICILAIGNSVLGQNTGFVKLEGNKFTLNGEPFYPVVANYSVRINLDESNVWHVCPPDWTFGWVDFESGNPLVHTYKPQMEYFDISSMEDIILQDFIALIDHGFNGIRLCGLGAGEHRLHNWCTPLPQESCTTFYQDYSNDLGFDYSERFSDGCGYPGGDWNSHASFNDIPAGLVLFPMIQKVLDIADDASDFRGKPFRVTLLTSGANVDQDWQLGDDVESKSVEQSRREDYTDFLAELAYYFKDNCTLMAYDLYNEPGSVSGFSGRIEQGVTDEEGDYRDGVVINNERETYSKQEVCGIVTAWNNAVKSNTTNQLTTIGLHGCQDVFEWDPAIMKVDFLSFHIYPIDGTFNDENNQDKILADAKRQLKWISNTVNKPWIIGEIGLSSSYNITCSDKATNAQQANYIDKTLDFTRDIGGIGYSWWLYKEGPYDYPCANNPDDYMGLWTAGNFSGLPIPTCLSIACSSAYTCTCQYSQPKDAVVEFGTFEPFNIDPSGGVISNNDYYNPYGYPSVAYIGIVIDQNLNPIANAVIIAKDVAGKLFCTFSNSNGEFCVYTPYTTLIEVNVSSATANIVSGSSPYQLTKVADEITINYDINGSQYTEAINKIFVNNSTISGNGITGANCEMKAGQSITLNTGFSAQKGCHFLAYLGPVDCNFLPSSKSPLMTGNNQPSNHEVNYERPDYSYVLYEDSIPESSNTELTFSIKPNPSNGEFSIVTNDLKSHKKSVAIYNSMGTFVLSKETDTKDIPINMNKFGKGLYSVTIDCENTRFTMKLLIQ